jgi:hypothetical protein
VRLAAHHLLAHWSLGAVPARLGQTRFTTAEAAERSLRQSGAFSFNLQMVQMVAQVGAMPLYPLERHLLLEHL